MFSPSRRPASKATPRAVILGLGVFGVLAVTAFAVLGYIAPSGIPGRSYYTVKANFARADGLVVHSDVKLGGRLVGQVLNPHIEDGHPVATLKLDADVAPLRSDTRLRVRPRGLLGVVYVEIAPGERGRPIPEGGSIPAKQTTPSIQLDDVLSTFDARTRMRTQTLLRQLGSGVVGRGEQLNTLLQQSPGYVHDFGSIAAAVNARPGSVTRFVQGAADLFTAIDPARVDLAAGFGPLAASFAPFVEQGQAWRAALGLAPQTLRVTRSGLLRTDPLLRSTDRLARQLTKTLDPAPRAFNATADLLKASRPSLQRLPATLALAREASVPTARLASRLDLNLPLLRAGLRPALPVARELGPRTCDFRSFLGHWGAMDSYGTSALNYLRASASIGSTESYAGYSEKQPLTSSNPYPKPCEAGWEHLAP